MAGPLTADDLREIDANLAKLKEAKAEIKRAELAGIDVAEQKAQVETLESQLSKIKQAYFPRG